jgi:hypothetical protein
VLAVFGEGKGEMGRDPLVGGRRSSLRSEGRRTEYSGDPDEEED